MPSKPYTALLLAAVFALWAGSASADPSGKIEICHAPPDDPDNVQLIHVGEKAADAHIAQHGDFEVGVECSEGIGECEVFGETVCVAGEDVCTASALSPPPEATEQSCGDGLDNDCDGATDAEDSDCACPCLALDGWADAIAETCPDGTPGGLPVINCDGDTKLPDYTDPTDYCTGRPEHSEATVNYDNSPQVKAETEFGSVGCVRRTATEGYGLRYFNDVAVEAGQACLTLIRDGCGLAQPSGPN